MASNLLNFCKWVHNMLFIGGSVQKQHLKNKRMLDFIENNTKLFLVIMYATGANNIKDEPGNSLSSLIMMLYYDKARRILSKFV